MSQQDSPSKILVTSGLPYANGDIHLGHLVEYILTDIFARYHKMCGRDIIYACATDAHGSPVELKALDLGIPPEEVAKRYHESHYRDMTAFGIHLDVFHTTHSDETRRHVEAIFEEARKKGLIYTKDVEGFYSPDDERYLPDRFIRGTCPNCKSPNQYGDSCEVCNVTYRPTDLIDPRSAVSGGTLELRTSLHYFYKLSATQDFLKDWVNSEGRMPDATRKFVNEWLTGGLQDWDISRDAPYFGFLVPGETDKYFYVWLDAPVGYIGATEKYCATSGSSVDDYWKDESTRIVHVIGKDIVYFHTLFWPSVLRTAGYNLPQQVHVHGFLTVNGQKMSKSRGTFINAATYLKHLDPEYLRYFFASKIRPGPEDLDLNLGTLADPDDPDSLDASSSEFVERVNAEFVNNVANFSSRVIQFLNKRLGSRLGDLPAESTEIEQRLKSTFEPRIAAAYESFDLASVMRSVTELALEANKYFQDSQPWKVIKDDPERARSICTLGANYVKAITAFLKPVVPHYASKVEAALAIQPLGWDDIRFDLANREIGQFETLVTRVDPEGVKAMVHDSRERASSQKKQTLDPPIKPEITIDEFLKVDLRVARVVAADKVEGADKLVQLTIDVGEPESRTIFAGIKKHYSLENLVDRRIVVVANLKPRKMRFGVSQGMLLAATDGDDVLLLALDGDPSSGSTVG